MHESTGKILLIGYGNPGRVDDGLGPALAEAISELHIPGATVDANYQLQVEDARAVADHDVIVLADADVRCDPPFSFELIQPSSEVSFSSHSISPASLLGMARDLFGFSGSGYALAIRGYEFDSFGERLSEQAKANLARAIEFIEPVLRNRAFEKSVTGLSAESSCSPQL